MDSMSETFSSYHLIPTIVQTHLLYPCKTHPARSCGRWLGVHVLLQLANLALLSNTTKTRLLCICRKKDLGFRYPHDRAGWSYLSHCSCKECCNSTNKKIEALLSSCYTCQGFYLGHSRIKVLTYIAIFDVLMTFRGLASADLKTTTAVRKLFVKNAMIGPSIN
ncbi:UNVERIFIED_CONTAM: hypothetical protein NCL1_29024 [Trichonephila clavipes]